MTEPVRRRTLVQLALASGGGLAANLLGGQAVRAAGSGDAIPEARSLRDAFPPQPYSPYAGREFADPGVLGRHPPPYRVLVRCRRLRRALRPRDAYRFAKGEEVIASTRSARAKLSRPLDFLVVADHSDNMGFFPGCSPASPRSSPTRTAGAGTT